MPKYPRLEREDQRKAPPATTPEGRDNQLAALAYQFAEKRLRNGTATAQEVVYFAKQGSTAAKTELEILERQKELITAKTESIQSAKRVDELYAEAIAAMRTYSGDRGGEDED